MESPSPETLESLKNGWQIRHDQVLAAGGYTSSALSDTRVVVLIISLEAEQADRAIQVIQGSICLWKTT